MELCIFEHALVKLAAKIGQALLLSALYRHPVFADSPDPGRSRRDFRLQGRLS